MKLLNGILVLDFSQYLSGPSAALRLADLGARVIKVERPGTGDNSRRLILKNLVSDGDSVNFQAINRNKESFAADLKDPEDLCRVRKLTGRADVLIENFRPGVMEKIGLGYEALKQINPGLIYGSITGYGADGPWTRRPGQDLLVQSMSGMTWLNGDQDQPPMPFALSLADSYAGVHLTEGIMACLLRRARTGVGGRVQVSLLESLLDLQFEVLTTYLNDGHKLPERAGYRNAHAYLSAPYGIYDTKDGHIALAMGSVPLLGEVLELPQLAGYGTKEQCFKYRDEIKQMIGERLRQKNTGEWLSRLEQAGYWASDVYNWEQLMADPAFSQMDFVLKTKRSGCEPLYTTRCPIRVNGRTIKPERPAPRLGEDTEAIVREFKLEED